LLLLLVPLSFVVGANGCSIEADVCPNPAACDNSPVDLGTLAEGDTISVEFDVSGLPIVADEFVLESDEVIWLGWYDDSRWRPDLPTAAPVEANPDVDFSCLVYTHPPPSPCPACDRGFTCTLANQSGDPLATSDLTHEATIDFFIPVGASTGAGVVAAFDEATAEILGFGPVGVVSAAGDTRVTIAVPEPGVPLGVAAGCLMLAAFSRTRKMS
jgi:hypothetical protein